MAQDARTREMENLVRPLVEGLGLTLWGMEYACSPGRSVLRIYVDDPAAGPVPAPGGGADKGKARVDDAPSDVFALFQDERDAPAKEQAADMAAESGPVSAPQGVNVDRCAEVSRHVGLALDVEDLVPGAYTLEVSSPGLERPFFAVDQVMPYVGREMALQLEEGLEADTPFPGRKRFQGVLERIDGDGDQAVLGLRVFEPGALPEDEEQGVLLSPCWAEIKKIHLVHRFEATGKPGGKSGDKSGKNAGAKKKKKRSR